MKDDKQPGGQPQGAPAPVPGAAAPVASDSSAPVDVSKLTPEEQMALFEKDLKENDWGHQPC
jgi:hypothetical protein